MKKSCVMVMAVLLICLMLPIAAQGRQDAAAEEEVTLRIQTRWATDAPHEVAFQNLVQEFDEANPDVTIIDESIGEEQAFNDRLRTSIATGNVPDLVYTLGGEAFKQYAENNVYADLEPEFEADPEWYEFFVPLFDNWTFDGLDGIYGVPYEIYGIALFYNEAIFDELGLDPPETIKEFEEVSEVLLAHDIIPFALGGGGPWRGGHLFTNLMIKRFGVDIVHQLGEREVDYTVPEIVEVFDLLDTWNQRGYFGQNIVTETYQDELAHFHNGNTAMHMDGSWYISTAVDTDIFEDMGVIPFPHFSDYPEYRNMWMGGSAGGLSVSGSIEGKQYEKTIELLKHLTSPAAFEYTQEFVGGGVYPVRMESDPDAVDQLTAAYSELLNSAGEMRTDIDAYDPLPQMQDRLRNSIQGMFAGSMDPMETAQEIQEEIDRN